MNDKRTPIIHHHLELSFLAPRPFNKYGCVFSFSYYVRPWRFLVDLWHEIGCFIHRGLYGWAECDTWSFDSYLLRLIPQALRTMQADKYGTPIWAAEVVAPDHDWQSDPNGDAIDWTQADAFFAAWVEDKAQACDDIIRLREDGPYAALYPPGYHELAQIRARMEQFIDKKGHIDYEAFFNAPDPLDALPDEVKQEARATWKKAMQDAHYRLQDLFSERMHSLWT